AGDAQRTARGWQGTLASLRLAPAVGAAWRLQAPAQFAQRGTGLTLSRSCFAAEGEGVGALCAEADWPRPGLSVQGEGLPLSLLAPYLPAREHDQAWVLRGTVDLDAQARPAGNALQGSVVLTSAEGGVRNSERSRNNLVGYRDLRLEATFDAARIEATLGSVFNDDGRIDARVATGWDAWSPLDGELAINTEELTFIELFSPDSVEPKSTLSGQLSLAGTRSEPLLGGQARLSGFSTELPALAILLEDGDVRLDAQADGS